MKSIHALLSKILVKSKSMLIQINTIVKSRISMHILHLMGISLYKLIQRHHWTSDLYNSTNTVVPSLSRMKLFVRLVSFLSRIAECASNQNDKIWHRLPRRGFRYGIIHFSKFIEPKLLYQYRQKMFIESTNC